MGHHVERCRTSSWRLRRFAHRPWICHICGQASITKVYSGYDGSSRFWQVWPEPDAGDT